MQLHEYDGSWFIVYNSSEFTNTVYTLTIALKKFTATLV